MSQARTFFYSVFNGVLGNWRSSEIELSRQLHETTMEYMKEVGIFERQGGSTIYAFTENFRSMMAEKMIDWAFPLGDTEPEVKAEAPKAVEVELKRNENPGYSLRFILGASKIIQEKFIEKYGDQIHGATVTHTFTKLMFQHDGLFLMIDSIHFDTGGSWQDWTKEDVKDFRILIQA
jgi:hypothetical protein